MLERLLQMGKEFKFQGYTFDDETTLVKAKKEAEAIEYLRSKTDFSNLNNLHKLYNRVLDKDMMETAVGIGFLKELRNTLIESGMFTENQLRPVPMTRERRKQKRRSEIQRRSREMTELEKKKRENAILKFLCFFLTGIVIAMFVIVLTGKRSPLAIRYEEELINKYSSWAQELTEREAVLGEYIRQLENSGIDVPDWIMPGTTQMPEVTETP